jgi:hypothetical protein
MRVGQGLFEAGSCKIGDSLTPKDIGGEILAEFYTFLFFALPVICSISMAYTAVRFHDFVI